MRLLRDKRPVKRSEIFSVKNIPNGLSLLRLLLVFPFVITVHDIFVYECSKNLFLLFIFFIIIASDAADGYLARKFNCASNTGARLDIVSDTFYTILSLAIFAYFNVVPIWFIFILVLKLSEFIITSKIIRSRQKMGKILFFDKIGKMSISAVMLLPGIFVFRSVITDYKMVMNIIIYIITVMLILSFVSRVVNTIKGATAIRGHGNEKN